MQMRPHEPWVRLAQACIIMGHNEHACQLLISAADYEPWLWEVWRDLTAVSAKCNHFEKAARAYRSTLKLNPVYENEEILKSIVSSKPTMADKSEREKPRTPEPLRKLLTVDKVLTKTFCDLMEKFLPYPKYRKHYKFLEYSCHALPWFFATLCALWLLWSEDLFQAQVNLVFGILIAELVQWLGKRALPNRARGKGRCFPSELYPSGGAIIATFVACFFCYLKPLYSHMRHLFVGWAAMVCVTRIMSCKHSILDVACGIFLGYLSAWILYHLWLDQDVCCFILTLEALTIDCMVISVTKAAVRRRRPAGNTNDMFLTVGIDAYSFPSGHVSRAVMIAYFAACITQTNIFLSLVAIVWAAGVSISRILMKRHHILDVLGGVIVGLAEGWLISHLWLSRATSLWLVNYLSDEAVNMEGLQDDEPLVIHD